MYVITVEFEVALEYANAFRAAIDENATLSRANEPECHQFDVCVDLALPWKFFLYELYTDRAAFDHHLATAHFLQFNALVTPWVVARQVRAYERTFPKS
jgi:(4S)-4-hydroxy-5-phosphonooxypentane-2,3-dione isomerase